MTTHYGVTHRTLPEPLPVLQQYPTVDPLPSPGVDRRRNHRGVCPYLLIAGESADPAEFTRRRDGSYGSEIKDASCATRHTGITGAYVLDVCTTSWHNNPRNGDRCPFLPETGAISPPRLPKGKRTCRKCKAIKPVDDFVQYHTAQGAIVPGAACRACYSGSREARHPPEEAAAILAAHRNGKTKHQIAKDLGIHPSYVYRLIAKTEQERAA